MAGTHRPLVRALFPAASLLVAAAACPAGSAFAAGPTVEYAMGLEPIQRGVEVDYDRLSPDEYATASIKMEKGKGGTAWVVRAADGRLLRSFADTDGDRVVDRWSYYKDGIEVYRDIDSDHNSKADQARWLGMAGSRWGVDENEDRVIERWKAISAEEATAEVVRAITSGDSAAFSRLLPTREELEQAGFRGGRLESLLGRVEEARRSFAAKPPKAASLGRQARWNNMLAPMPGVLPADGEELLSDINAYDNVVALVDSAEGGGQVFIGSLLKCGDAWRVVDLPQVPAADGEIREPMAFFTPRLPPSGISQPSDRLAPLLERLRGIESRLAEADAAGRPALIGEQIGLLEEVVAAAEPDERAFWVKQLAETIAAAVQEAAVEDGIERLESLAASVADDGMLEAFVTFRLASARYAAGMTAQGADVEAVQSAWLEELAEFVKQHPRSEDAAEALLQMAIADEFAGREKEAIARYETITADFPESSAARKAAGAARRLTSVGTQLSLSGKTPDGRALDSGRFRGTPLLVHYWATWCEPCKVDIARIRELREKFGPQRFSVMGISLDTDAAGLRSYLSSSPLAWPTLHEPGGLDGRLAEELGVLTLPTMILIDAEGEVVDRNVLITDLERKLGGLLDDK